MRGPLCLTVIYILFWYFIHWHNLLQPHVGIGILRSSVTYNVTFWIAKHLQQFGGVNENAKSINNGKKVNRKNNQSNTRAHRRLCTHTLDSRHHHTKHVVGNRNYIITRPKWNLRRPVGGGQCRRQTINDEKIMLMENTDKLMFCCRFMLQIWCCERSNWHTKNIRIQFRDFTRYLAQSARGDEEQRERMHSSVKWNNNREMD